MLLIVSVFTLLCLHRTSSNEDGFLVFSIVVLCFHLFFYICCIVTGVIYFLSFKHSFEIVNLAVRKDIIPGVIDISEKKIYDDNGFFTVGTYRKMPGDTLDKVVSKNEFHTKQPEQVFHTNLPKDDCDTNLCVEVFDTKF